MYTYIYACSKLIHSTNVHFACTSVVEYTGTMTSLGVKPKTNPSPDCFSIASYIYWKRYMRSGDVTKDGLEVMLMFDS